MKIIKLFLASSIHEFKHQRMELASFVLSLNNEFVPKGIYFELIICETLSDAMAHERKQEEYNEKIRKSDFVYFLIGEKVGEYTAEEFTVAREQFEQSGKRKPDIFVFFRKLPEGVAAEDSLPLFRQQLDELQQPYIPFDGLEKVKQSLEHELRSEAEQLLSERNGEAKPEGDGITFIKAFIKLFVASSTKASDDTPFEFGKNERNELGAFIAALNDRYIKRGIYLAMKFSADLAQALDAERSRSILNSRYFYIILGKETDKQSVADFNQAHEQFEKERSPQIYTYFRKLPDGEEPAQEVIDFMQRLAKVMGHYPSPYDHLDRIKNKMMMELIISPEVHGEVKFVDGKILLEGILFDGPEAPSLSNIPFYSKNQTIKNLKDERDRLNKEVAKRSAEYFKNTDDANLRSEFLAATNKLDEIDKQIRNVETKMIDLYVTLLKYTGSGNDIHWQIQEAVKLMDDGNYDGALALLDAPNWLEELKHDDHIAIGYKRMFEGRVIEIQNKITKARLYIKALMATKGITPETIPDIQERYDKCSELAKKYKINIELLYEYAGFLYEIRDYSKSFILLEWINNNFCDFECNYDISYFIGLNKLLSITTHYDTTLNEAYSILCNSLEIINTDAVFFERLRQYYTNKINYIRELIKNNEVLIYDDEICIQYYNLLYLLYFTGNYKELKDLCREIIMILNKFIIFEDLKKHYTKNILTITDIFMTIAMFTESINDYKESEKIYNNILSLYYDLLECNHYIYQECIVSCLYKLRNLMLRMGCIEKSKEFHNKALLIDSRNQYLENKFCSINLINIDTKCMVLADILVENNEFFDIAEQLYKVSTSVRCLQMYEVPTGYDMAIDGTEKFAMCCSKLANLLEITGRYDEAEKYRRDVLAIYRDLTDEFTSGFDEDVAKCCENLADLLVKMNKFEEADELREEAEEIRQRLVSQ